MDKLFFAIFDKKAGIYDHVQSFRSEADAVRAVRSLVNSGERGGLISQYPADFELFAVGVFNTVEGVFDSERPRFVVSLGVLVDVSTPEVSNG